MNERRKCFLVQKAMFTNGDFSTTIHFLAYVMEKSLVISINFAACTETKATIKLLRSTVIFLHRNTDKLSHFFHDWLVIICSRVLCTQM